MHFAIFDALDRDEEPLYEFRFGKRPDDRKGPVYVHPAAFDPYEESPPGVADETTLESLSLRVRRRCYYLFDFGDDWWHVIEVMTIAPAAPAGKFPKVTERIGQSPPQYPDFDE